MTNRLHDECLNGDLEENFPDDPYGTAVFVIRNVLSRALSPNMIGTMSDGEARNLNDLSRLLMAVDPHATVEVL